jgi:hypothetical protein
MAKKKVNWLPARRADQLAMAKRWLQVLGTKAAAWGVPAAEVTALGNLAGEAESGLDLINSGEDTKVVRAKCRTDFTLLVAKMRFIKRHYFLQPPLTDEDIASLGLETADSIKTPTTEVKDTTELWVTNDTAADTHVQYVHFKIAGSTSDAKDPYYACIMQTCIRAPAEPPPSIDNNAEWGKDIVCMASPEKVQHKAADAGKTCYYRAQWQARNSFKGPWTPVTATVP